REDLMGVLLAAADDSGERLSDREVRDHLVTLLFAGHDTTTSSVAFLFHELLRHPAALERVLEEQDRTRGGRARSWREVMGCGARTCTGMRFGQLQIKTIATLLLQRFLLEPVPGYKLDIRMMPTLSPKHGLPLRVLERRA